MPNTNDIEKELGGVMLKPDTIDRGLGSDIIRDINTEGYETIFQTDVTLDAEDVDWLYPELCSINGVRDRLVGYLAGRSVSLISVKKILPDIDNPTQHLHDLKGNKLAGTGIRGRYRDGILDPSEIDLKTKGYYFYMMVNNLHVFDSVEIFVNFLRRKGVDMTVLSGYLES